MLYLNFGKNLKVPIKRREMVYYFKASKEYKKWLDKEKKQALKK